ncbi:MAG: tetratricopeptide repeat protein [Fermentimonas sp.]|jgi:tetratricopeptide (TPR) repeat protein
MKQSILQILVILSMTFFFTLGAYGQNRDARVNELITEGVEFHDAGDYEGAIDCYLEALELDSTSVLANYELSLSYLALKDFENALEYSSWVIISSDEQLCSGAYAVKSEALAGLNRVDEAIELLREGLEKHGDEYLLHFNMALNYYKKGNIDKTLEHLKRAIDLDKRHSGAFLLNAYALNDRGLWIQSILSFQMFLLLEPDSRRSKNAFEEMLQTMRVKKKEEPVERSFTQLQMTRGESATAPYLGNSSPLASQSSIDQSSIYRVITSTIDSLKAVDTNIDEFKLFKTVNKAFISELEEESMGNKEGILWTFYVPFFSRISNSNYYDTFCRYISVSYYPESLEWWQQNPDAAVNFVIWFEKGDAS